jgi:tetratricopeptide (TPR) repeat protein
MNGEPSTAVFISYRRDVGGILALALYQYLAERGLDAFYDIESIRAGQFDTIILNQIAARPYFLLVLTPGTLERSGDPKDWLRREIEQALATRRVIVPVHTPSFDFRDFERFLPGDLGQEVQRFNGQELPQKWFKFAVQQLIEEFLLPIQIENVAPPAEDQAVVERLRQEAEAAPAVTEVQLSAHAYFERAHARPDDDVDGKIADYSEAVRLDPHYALAFNNRGAARHDNGDLEGAIADFSEAVRLDPHYALAFNNRGAARHDNGDLEGAIADCSEALRLDPELAGALHNRGLARRKKGDLEGAISDYSDALGLDPEDVGTLYKRGLALYDKGELEGAIADYSEVLRLDPQDKWAFNNRGNIRLAKGDVEGAIADYSEALRIDPHYTGAFYNRGLARYDERDLQGAIADYSEALRLDPHYADVFYNRGLARRANGDLEGGIADIEQAARLAPENRDFSGLLDEIRRRAPRRRGGKN